MNASAWTFGMNFRWVCGKGGGSEHAPFSVTFGIPLCSTGCPPYSGIHSRHSLPIDMQGKNVDKLGRNAASRVSKYVPNLVFSMEQYERYLIQVWMFQIPSQYSLQFSKGRLGAP
jgi:hypothetical protein